jgi:hypothetical protein
MSGGTAEVVAARVTGIGIGLLVFMIAWLVGARIAERIWEAPVGPVVAMATAVVIEALAAVWSGHRFAAGQRT